MGEILQFSENRFIKPVIIALSLLALVGVGGTAISSQRNVSLEVSNASLGLQRVVGNYVDSPLGSPDGWKWGGDDEKDCKLIVDALRTFQQGQGTFTSGEILDLTDFTTKLTIGGKIGTTRDWVMDVVEVFCGDYYQTDVKESGINIRPR
jgi:hypothetical protein